MWYGNAQSAKGAPRKASGQRTLNAVRGVNGRSGASSSTVDPATCRAVYGSTDAATVDRRNAPLCRALPITQAAKLRTVAPSDYVGARYTGNVTRMHYATVESWDGPTDQADIDALVRVATAHNQTLAEYCAERGIAL